MYYFASDSHLGLTYRGQEPRERERLMVEWLRSISKDCEALFLVGDIFDFWFEWSEVVPRGYTRLLGQLASMTDSGIEIHFMVGNHDMWMGDYFTRELGITVHTEPLVVELSGRTLFIAHGDNLGQRDFSGRTLSRLFRSKSTRWMFSQLLHPNCSMRMGNSWSSSSRHSRVDVSHTFRAEKERVVVYAREYLAQHPTSKIDYFVCGHLHTPTIYPLTSTSNLVILGEWIVNPIYGTLDQHGNFSLVNLLPRDI